jgi:hypothetical protein
VGALFVYTWCIALALITPNYDFYDYMMDYDGDFGALHSFVGGCWKKSEPGFTGFLGLWFPELICI